MKLHRLYAEIDKFKGATPSFGMEAWIALSRQMLDFEPAGSRWNPGLFHWTEGKGRLGTFFSVADLALIGVTDDARRSPTLWAELERCGEFLPITIEGYGQAYIYRILKCGGALDEKKTDFMTLDNGKRVALQPVFNPRSFKEDGLVRVADAPLASLYVQKTEASIIHQEYTRHKMTGLDFKILHGADAAEFPRRRGGPPLRD